MNDFLESVNLFGGDGEKSANLLPPEIILFGVQVDPWHPIDSLAILKSLNFHLTWSWQMDLHRTLVSVLHPDLEELIEELLPMSSEFAYDMVTVLADDDIKN